MSRALFKATERFDPSDGEKWEAFLRFAKIPRLLEVVSLDALLCPNVVKEIRDEDWSHIVIENYPLDYFYHLDYLKQRIQDVSRRNILGVYRNPENHILVPPAPEDFAFFGYDLIEDQTGISALINCGGFPDVFRNDELNRFGLIDAFERACSIRQLLAERYPAEHHAQCEIYAIWRLRDSEPLAAEKAAVTNAE